MKDISHTKGDTFIRNITFKDANWDAIDITSSIIKFSLKRDISSEIALISEDVIITDAINWLAEIQINSSLMNIANWGYFYDIQWTDNEWIIRTVLKWNFTITYEITT